MPDCIAKRELMYSLRGADERNRLVVRVFAPFEVQPGSVDFNVDEGVAGCIWEVEGLPEKATDTAFGADSIQALQFASDVDTILRSLRRRYDFYFPTGEPYFED